MEPAAPTHCNFCRVTATPEEVILDCFYNPNLFGAIVNERVPMQARIVMSPEAAKRTLAMLSDTLRQFEERFGAIKADPREKVLQPTLS